MAVRTRLRRIVTTRVCIGLRERAGAATDTTAIETGQVSDRYYSPSLMTSPIIITTHSHRVIGLERHRATTQKQYFVFSLPLYPFTSLFSYLIFCYERSPPRSLAIKNLGYSISRKTDNMSQGCRVPRNSMYTYSNILPQPFEA